MAGAPNGPVGFRVSAIRQGVTGTNCKPTAARTLNENWAVAVALFESLT
jgi:hypothetical protein